MTICDTHCTPWIIEIEIWTRPTLHHLILFSFQGNGGTFFHFAI